MEAAASRGTLPTRIVYPGMEVHFFKGILKERYGRTIPVWWARTPYGVRAWRQGRQPERVDVKEERLTNSEEVTSLDLEGLEGEDLDALVDHILSEGYLDRPGVQGKGDAVLFVVVNEALHVTAEIERLEREELAAQGNSCGDPSSEE
jgi:hypothetical protein